MQETKILQNSQAKRLGYTWCFGGQDRFLREEIGKRTYAGVGVLIHNEFKRCIQTTHPIWKGQW